jgi:hypothetical protein
MRRAFGAGARTMRAHIARNILFTSMHRATARAHLRNSKSHDEIRISCTREVCAQRASACKTFASAHFFRARLHVDRACVQSKIILHNLPRATASLGRNRSKKSESVTSDSRQIPSRGVKFFIRARIATRFKSKTFDA